MDQAVDPLLPLEFSFWVKIWMFFTLDQFYSFTGFIFS